ncbi:folylpolyglutamate synthase [Apiospora arundinis]
MYTSPHLIDIEERIRLNTLPIRNIACHKTGIFKPGAVAFSSAQDFEETVTVLEKRAAESGVLLRFVPSDDPDLPRDSPNLMPDVQRANCSLALAAVRALQ